MNFSHNFNDLSVYQLGNFLKLIHKRLAPCRGKRFALTHYNFIAKHQYACSLCFLNISYGKES